MAATIGKVTFDGKNLTEAPYHAHLTTEAKYWFLNGFESMQIPVDPQRLISTQSYLKDWIISAVFRVEPPEETRTAMLTALAKLAALLDPTRGEKKLIFDEFPYSYFIAKGQTFALANEDAIPYMVDVEVAFACTGPSYSNVETVQHDTISDSPLSITVVSEGDSTAWPRYRITPGEAFSGDVVITNATTAETMTWNGSLQTNDVLDIIIDAEYGVPYSAFKNGAVAIDNLTGPAWPRLAPGENDITIWGPTSGTVETRWRDRFLVGLQTYGTETQIYITADKTTPNIGELVTFQVYLAAGNVPLSRPVTVYHFRGGERTVNYTANTGADGWLTYSVVMPSPGTRPYYAEFMGDPGYLASWSTAATININVQTRIQALSPSKKLLALDEVVTLSGTLQWYDPTTSTWKANSVVDALPVNINHETMDMYGTLSDIITENVTTGSTGAFTIDSSWGTSKRCVYWAEHLKRMGYGESITPTVNIDINPHTRITMTSDKTSCGVGDWVKFTGKLYYWNVSTNAWNPGTANSYTGGKTIYLSSYKNGGDYVYTSMAADSTGWYQFDIQTADTAEYECYITFDASSDDPEKLQGCQAGPITITVS